MSNSIKFFNFKGARFPVHTSDIKPGSYFDTLFNDCKDSETIDWGENDAFKDASYETIQMLLPGGEKMPTDMVKYVELHAAVEGCKIQLFEVLKGFVDIVDKEKIETLAKILEILNQTKQSKMITSYTRLKATKLQDMIRFKFKNQKFELHSLAHWHLVLNNSSYTQIKEISKEDYIEFLSHTDFPRHVKVPDSWLISFFDSKCDTTPSWMGGVGISHNLYILGNVLMWSDSSKQKVMEDLISFKSKFNRLTFNLFEEEKTLNTYLTSHQISVAGGIVSESLRINTVSRTSDVDIFILDASIFENVLQCFETYAKSKSKNIYFISVRQKNAPVIDIVMDDIPVVYSIIVSPFASIFQLLTSFDLSHCMVAYDGNKVLTTENGRYAYESGISKYEHREYALYKLNDVPGGVYRNNASRVYNKCILRGFLCHIYATNVRNDVAEKMKAGFPSTLQPRFTPISAWSTEINMEEIAKSFKQPRQTSSNVLTDSKSVMNIATPTQLYEEFLDSKPVIPLLDWAKEIIELDEKEEAKKRKLEEEIKSLEQEEEHLSKKQKIESLDS